jgi:aquaporin Z
MKQSVVEFIGTFLLTCTFGLTMVPPNVGPFAPLAIGAALAALVYAGREISGAHYNPAVTLAVWIRGKCSMKHAAMMMVAQVCGALAAGFLVVFMRSGTTTPLLTLDPAKALVAEFVFAFALVLVFLSVMAAGRERSSSGLALGFVLMAGMYCTAPISGGAFNPAIAVGSAVTGLGTWATLWIYFLAEFAGAAVAALLFRAVSPAESL